VAAAGRPRPIEPEERVYGVRRGSSKSTIRAALALAICSLLTGPAWAMAAQAGHPGPEGGPHSVSRPCFVGSSLFMLANLAPDEYPPKFYQLNAGYQITPRDRLSVEAIAWTYYHPLGIPWGPSRDAAGEAYPGRVREQGVGVVYQRFLWNGLYSSLGAVPFRRQYLDTQGQEIGSGLQLYLTLRLGYHVDLLDRVFLEPSIAFNHWPVSTHVPDGFAAQDRKWPSYFLFEPGLHVGFEF
jgi:hypothetical protein